MNNRFLSLLLIRLFVCLASIRDKGVVVGGTYLPGPHLGRGPLTNLSTGPRICCSASSCKGTYGF